MNVELSNYIKDMITKKGFDDFTSKKILDYIEAHDVMYGHIIDTKDVVDRISENLNKNIDFDFLRNSIARGGYSPISKCIYIGTSDFGDDEYFHEIDHCATADLSTMPDFEAENAWDDEVIDKRSKDGYKYYVGIEISGQEPSGPDFFVRKNRK